MTVETWKHPSIPAPVRLDGLDKDVKWVGYIMQTNKMLSAVDSKRETMLSAVDSQQYNAINI